MARHSQICDPGGMPSPTRYLLLWDHLRGCAELGRWVARLSRGDRHHEFTVSKMVGRSLWLLVHVSDVDGDVNAQCSLHLTQVQAIDAGNVLAGRVVGQMEA